MTQKVVFDMLVALVLIAIIVLFGGIRMIVKSKFDVTEHFDKIDEAVARNKFQQRKLHHNVHTK